MIIRKLIALPAVIAFGLVLMPGAAQAQEKSIKEQLVGTWTLASWVQTRPDGSKFDRFGANPKGVNVFTADGRFFLMFARGDLPKISSNNPMEPTPDEAKAIVTGAIAYFGTYTVDEPTKTVTVRIDSSTLPNQLGMEHKRTITALTNDELRYTNANPVNGGKIEAGFRRATPATN